MTSNSSQTCTPVDELDNARIGYQVAVGLWTYQGQTNWAVFNVMLVANSIVIAVSGLAITAERQLPILAFSLPLAGLVLCGVWFLLMKRGFDYEAYYVWSARELEEEHLAPLVRVVSRGGQFASSQEVDIKIAGALTKRKMSTWGNFLRAQQAGYIAVVIFAVLYVIMLFQG